MRAASNTEVPSGTVTAMPSIVSCTSLIVSDHPKPATSCTHRTHALRTHFLENVRFDLASKMLPYRTQRRMGELTETTYRRQLQRLREFRNQLQVPLRSLPMCPAGENIDHLLRSHAARHALPAGLIAEKPHSVERHVEHAAALRANHDGARPKHGPSRGQRFEIQSHVHHRCGQISRRRTRRRESFQRSSIQNSARAIVDYFRHRQSHGDFENSRIANVTAHAYKLQACRAALPLRFVPIHSVDQDLRYVGEGFHVI